MVDPYAIVRRLTGHELISPKDARLLTEAVDDLIDEIGSMDARIAELEAEVERLTKERDDALMVKREAVAGWRDAESLSRTGAVKVRREDVAKLVYEAMSWAAMCGPTPNGTVPVWEDRGNSLGQEEARRIADRILSALEPAAPEIGSMEAYNAATKAMAARMANTAILVGDSEPSIDGEHTDADGYPYAFDALTRPSEQAVTEAMVEAATRELLAHGEFSSIPGNNETNARTAARAALNAAMEAGRPALTEGRQDE